MLRPRGNAGVRPYPHSLARRHCSWDRVVGLYLIRLRLFFAKSFCERFVTPPFILANQ